MKKLLIVAMLLALSAAIFIPVIALGGPWIGNATPITDIDLTNGVVQVDVDGTIDSTNYPIKADGTISYDISGLAPGVHVLRFRAGNPYTATNGDAIEWGGIWSVPFDLTRPARPSTVMNPLLRESP